MYAYYIVIIFIQVIPICTLDLAHKANVQKIIFNVLRRNYMYIGKYIQIKIILIWVLSLVWKKWNPYRHWMINNNNNVPFLYSAYHIQMASLCAWGISTPALALMQPFSAKSIRRNTFLLGTHLLHLGWERQCTDKMPCLRAYAPSGIRTPRLSDCKSRARTTTPQCPHFILYCRV